MGEKLGQKSEKKDAEANRGEKKAEKREGTYLTMLKMLGVKAKKVL